MDDFVEEKTNNRNFDSFIKDIKDTRTTWAQFKNLKKRFDSFTHEEKELINNTLKNYKPTEI